MNNVELWGRKMTGPSGSKAQNIPTAQYTVLVYY